MHPIFQHILIAVAGYSPFNPLDHADRKTSDPDTTMQEFLDSHSPPTVHAISDEKYSNRFENDLDAAFASGEEEDGDGFDDVPSADFTSNENMDEDTPENYRPSFEDRPSFEYQVNSENHANPEDHTSPDDHTIPRERSQLRARF